MRPQLHLAVKGKGSFRVPGFPEAIRSLDTCLLVQGARCLELSPQSRNKPRPYPVDGGNGLKRWVDKFMIIHLL